MPVSVTDTGLCLSLFSSVTVTDTDTDDRGFPVRWLTDSDAVSILAVFIQGNVTPYFRLAMSHNTCAAMTGFLNRYCRRVNSSAFFRAKAAMSSLVAERLK